MNLGLMRGVIPAVVTPFGPDGNVDHDVLARLTKGLVDAGVHGIMATGGTGEFPHLTDEERVAVTQTIVTAVDRRIPVIAGTAACTTADVLRLTERVAEVGADAIITVPPYYFPLPDAALMDFFTALAADSSLPIFVYNNPGYTGNPLNPALLTELLQMPQVVGLKQSDADLGQFVEVIYQIRTLRKLDKCLMTGIDSQLCAAIATGGHGIYSTAAGLVPQRVVQIFDLASSGDIKAAHIAQLELQPLNRFLEYDPGYVAPAKEALRLMGYEVGDPRSPLPRLSDSDRSRLRDALTTLGCLPAGEGGG